MKNKSLRTFFWLLILVFAGFYSSNPQALAAARDLIQSIQPGTQFYPHQVLLKQRPVPPGKKYARLCPTDNEEQENEEGQQNSHSNDEDIHWSHLFLSDSSLYSTVLRSWQDQNLSQAASYNLAYTLFNKRYLLTCVFRI